MVSFEQIWARGIQEIMMTMDEEHRGAGYWESRENVILGRIVRAAAIERLFDSAKGMVLRVIFATVSLFDRYYDPVNKLEVEILGVDTDDVNLTMLVAMVVVLMDDPCQDFDPVLKLQHSLK